MKTWQKFTLLLLFSLLFRLLLAPGAVNGDILTQAQWGNWIYHHGFLGLYDERVWSVEWPNHPPLISMWYGVAYSLHSTIMWILTNLGSFIALNHLGASKILFYFNFLHWFGNEPFELTGVLNGIIVTLKLLPMLADLCLGFIVYKLAKVKKSAHPFFWAALYLLLPFSWYLSALWGQTDQVATLFLFLAFYLGYKKNFLLSPFFLALSLNLKPTVLLFLPLYLFWVLRSKPDLKQLIPGLFLACLSFFLTAAAFSDQNVFFFTQDHLVRTLFFTKTPATTISAFNLWFVFHGNDRLLDTTSFLLPFRVWGLLAFLILNLLAMKITWQKKWPDLIFSLFLVGFGGWLVLTNMYERYAFAGLFFGLILCIYHPKLLKFWITLSFIYLLDMYHGWWYPEWLPYLQNLIYVNNWFFARILSLGNIFLFLTIGFKVAKSSKFISPNFKLHFKPNFGKIL